MLATITRRNNIWLIRPETVDRGQMLAVVECCKEAGARWSQADMAWILAESRKAEAFQHALMFAHTPAELMAGIRKHKAESIGLPRMDGQLEPPGMRLMAHQKAGVEFVAQREGSLLAWQVGTGKTAASIACINAAGERGVPALVICPAHLKLNWYTEMKGDPDLNKRGWLVNQNLTVGIASGGYFPGTDIVIINYDILDRHKATIDAINWSFAILDESHFLRSPRAKRTRAVIGGRVKDRDMPWPRLHAKRRICLSGTPLVNKPEDVWAICNWLDAARWPSEYWFKQTFCTINDKTIYVGGKQRQFREILPPSKAKMEDLNRRLCGTIMSRIRSVDVLDLPPLRRRVIELDIDASGAIHEERAAVATNAADHDRLRAAVQIAKALGNDVAYAQAIHELSDWVNKQKEHVAILRQKVAMAKVPHVVDHIRNILLDDEKKVLCFAHHHAVIIALAQQCRKWLPEGVVTFYGNSSHEEKLAAERRIQHDRTCRLFIGGITSAGTGLTLTAASHVVFAEEDWVPANMRQAEGRAWRKGQTQPVMVEHIVAHGSIDARIAKRMIAKQEVADNAIDAGLTMEEPVDWVEDHSAPLSTDEEKPVPDKARAAYKYGMARLAANPKMYHVNGMDLIVASRLAALPVLEGYAAIIARHLARKYLGEQDSP